MSACRQVIDIEDLLGWAIAREYAHLHAERAGLHAIEAAAGGLEVQAVSGDGCAGLARIAGLGCRPDGGGLAGLGAGSHPDAEAVYLIAKRVLAPPDFFLVIGYAKAGTRPGWGAHIKPVEAWPVRTWDGRVMELRPRGQAVRCPVRYVDRAREIPANRMVYRAWWCALRTLALALAARADSLRRFTATGPGADETPWMHPQDGAVLLDNNTLS